jgi:NAD-dependent dihydropyrimidine dehydrogenase PreA subunit
MDLRYTKLADNIGLGQSERIAELFKALADETDADIMLAMPGQPGEIAAKLGLSEEEVAGRIHDLFIKGVAFPSPKTDPPTWRMCRNLVQFHDASLLWPEAPVEFYDLWRDYMDNEWFGLAKTIAKSTPKPFTRVIPVDVSIEARTSVLPFDSVREIVEKSKSISVTKCTCRLSMRKCDRPLEVCLQVNKAADYNIARGTGRKLDKEEALKLLKECEEAGLIHVTMNRAEADNFICNCCPCCCQTMPVLLKGGIHVIDPSRFVAFIDEDLCSGCGLCHERCYFSAISWSEDEGSPSVVDPGKCMGCGLCMVTCPEEAIALNEIREPAFVPGA